MNLSRTEPPMVTIGIVIAFLVLASGWFLALPRLATPDEILRAQFRTSASWSGMVALVFNLGFFARHIRRNARRNSPYGFACIVGAATGLSALIRWLWDGGNTTAAFSENLVLLSLHIAATGSVTLIVFLLLARGEGTRFRESDTLPSITSLFLFWGGMLACVCTISMGLLVSPNVWGTLNTPDLNALHEAADLIETNLIETTDRGDLKAKLTIIDRTTSLNLSLMNGTPDTSDDGWYAATNRRRTWLKKIDAGRTIYATVRAHPHGYVWISTQGLPGTPPLGEGPLKALIICALIVLLAPLASSLLGQRLRRDLLALSESLRMVQKNTFPSHAPKDLVMGMGSTSEVDALSLSVQNAYRLSIEQWNELDTARRGAQRNREAKNHFLRTSIQMLTDPLNTVHSQLNRLTTSPETINGDLHEDLRLVRESAIQLETYLSQLRTLEHASQLSASTATHSIFDPVKLIEHEFALARGRKTPGVALTLTRPSAPIRLHANREQVVQLVRNLLSNALKYTPKGHVEVAVEIGARVDGSQCMNLTFKDTGIGIPEGEQDAIFDDFFRGSGTTSLPGTGIGLSLCRSIAEGHGGTIALKSQPGAGSIFYVVLPGAMA